MDYKYSYASPPLDFHLQILANAPNGKVSTAIAEILSKEGIAESAPQAGKEQAQDGDVKPSWDGEGEGFSPVVYVAMVSFFFFFISARR